MEPSQWADSIHVRHDPCGSDSEPVRELAEAEHFRDQHICPKGELHA